MLTEYAHLYSIYENNLLTAKTDVDRQIVFECVEEAYYYDAIISEIQFNQLEQLFLSLTKGIEKP